MSVSSSAELYFLVWLQHILHEVLKIENSIVCVISLYHHTIFMGLTPKCNISLIVYLLFNADLWTTQRQHFHYLQRCNPCSTYIWYQSSLWNGTSLLAPCINNGCLITFELVASKLSSTPYLYLVVSSYFLICLAIYVTFQTLMVNI